MKSCEEKIRFEKFMIQRGKSPKDFDFMIEYDTPRQSDVFPVTGRVFIKNITNDTSRIYKFGSSNDWLVDFSDDIERDLI